MKKNNSMRVAIIVIALTLITSCFVGSTFAKYQSTVTGSDTATVAKWDIKAGVVDGELSITGATPTVAFNLFDTINDTGNAADETDVADGKIAPGTAGSFTFSVKNDSDVTAKWKVDFATGTNLYGVPLQFKVGDGEWKTTLDATEFANIAMGASATVAVEWKWEFGGDASVAVDTPLGVTPVSPVVQINLTVEQVD